MESNYLTEIEHNVITAVQNEQESGGDVLEAFENAACYADQYGYTVAEFRTALESLFGKVK